MFAQAYLDLNTVLFPRSSSGVRHQPKDGDLRPFALQKQHVQLQEGVCYFVTLPCPFSGLLQTTKNTLLGERDSLCINNEGTGEMKK